MGEIGQRWRAIIAETWRRGDFALQLQRHAGLAANGGGKRPFLESSRGQPARAHHLWRGGRICGGGHAGQPPQPAVRRRAAQPAGHHLGAQPGQHRAPLHAPLAPGAQKWHPGRRDRSAPHAHRQIGRLAHRAPSQAAMAHWPSAWPRQIVQNGWHDEAWLAQHTVGWPELRARLADYPLPRVAEITGLPQDADCPLRPNFMPRRPALIKIADGLQRNFNGGQTVRAICALPALLGNTAVCGGGLAYSTSGYLQWDGEAVAKHSTMPATGAQREHEPAGCGAAGRGERSADPIAVCLRF